MIIFSVLILVVADCFLICCNFAGISKDLCLSAFCLFVWYLISCLFRCSKCFIKFCSNTAERSIIIFKFTSFVVFFNFSTFYELKIKGAIKVRQTIKIFFLSLFLFECISGVGGKCLRLFSHSCTVPVVLERWWWEKSRKRKQWFSIPLLFNKTWTQDKETDEFSWHIKQVIKSRLKQQHNQFTPFYRIVVKSLFYPRLYEIIIM